MSRREPCPFSIAKEGKARGGASAVDNVGQPLAQVVQARDGAGAFHGQAAGNGAGGIIHSKQPLPLKGAALGTGARLAAAGGFPGLVQSGRGAEGFCGPGTLLHAGSAFQDLVQGGDHDVMVLRARRRTGGKREGGRQERIQGMGSGFLAVH